MMFFSKHRHAFTPDLYQYKIYNKYPAIRQQKKTQVATKSDTFFLETKKGNLLLQRLPFLPIYLRKIISSIPIVVFL